MQGLVNKWQGSMTALSTSVFCGLARQVAIAGAGGRASAGVDEVDAGAADTRALYRIRRKSRVEMV